MSNNIENIINRVKSYLPVFVLESKILKNIFEAIIYESNDLNKYIDTIINELNISTASKSIDKWEAMAGIDNRSLNIDERRDSVIKKFGSQVHANYYNFLQMLKTYDDTTILKEIIGEYRIEIKTKNHISYDDFLNYLNVINNYKPAHIGVSVEINREYEIKYYMNNILINDKSIITNICINSPKNLSINKPYINFLSMQNKYMNIKVGVDSPGILYINKFALNIIPTQNRSINVKTNNKLCNIDNINYTSSVIVQKLKIISV